MGLAELEAEERKVYSQNGEDGVLQAIFAAIGTTNRYFVEFGCQDATECNGAYLLEQGWSGLLMDGSCTSNNPRATIYNEFITAENINYLFRKYAVPPSFDLLSIDIDGNDYWIWQAITYRPRVVVIEYNAHVPPSERKTIAYKPDFVWNGTDYFGASLRALKELGEQKGYTLVHCERTGVNAIFVATEALPNDYTPRRVEMIYRPPNYAHRKLGFRYASDSSHVLIDPKLCTPPTTTFPTVTIELLVIAMQHQRGGRWNTAELICRQLLLKEPNHVDVLHLSGVVLHQLDQREEAIEYIRRAIQINSNEASFHNSLGNVLKAQQKWGEAVDTYRRAIELKPDYVIAYVHLGNTFKAMGKLDDAIAEYQRALEKKPDYGEAYNNIGNVFYVQKKFDQAMDAYHRALKVQPNFFEAYNNLGTILSRLGRSEEAAAAFQRGIELDPKYDGATVRRNT